MKTTKTTTPLEHAIRASYAGFIATLAGAWLAGAHPPRWLLYVMLVWSCLVCVLNMSLAIMGSALHDTTDQ